jgi:TM2 domain-containing membrane protein YozV
MFCPQCGVSNEETSRFCRSCGSSLTAKSEVPVQYVPAPPVPVQPPVQQPYPLQGDPRIRGVAYPNRQYAVGKNPGVALILSLLIVGVGQFYNGDAKKGVLMLIGAVVLGVFTLSLGWFAIAIWSAIDAYQVASGKSPIWS